MTNEDEFELLRLCEMLREVHKGLEAESPLREAVTKAALGLSFAYTHGSRSKIEEWALGIGKPLSDTGLQHLRSLGINPGQSLKAEQALPGKP